MLGWFDYVKRDCLFFGDPFFAFLKPAGACAWPLNALAAAFCFSVFRTSLSPYSWFRPERGKNPAVQTSSFPFGRRYQLFQTPGNFVCVKLFSALLTYSTFHYNRFLSTRFSNKTEHRNCPESVALWKVYLSKRFTLPPLNLSQKLVFCFWDTFLVRLIWYLNFLLEQSKKHMAK